MLEIVAWIADNKIKVQNSKNYKNRSLTYRIMYIPNNIHSNILTFLSTSSSLIIHYKICIQVNTKIFQPYFSINNILHLRFLYCTLKSLHIWNHLPHYLCDSYGVDNILCSVIFNLVNGKDYLIAMEYKG